MGRMRCWQKHLAGSCCLYQLRDKPILILGTRRSGSTLMMRMLYSQRGVDYVDQPLDLWRYHPYRKQLPVPALNQFLSTSPEEQASLKSFFADLLSGRKRLRHQWNLFDRHFSWIVRRLVLKELNLKDVDFIDWLAARCEVVYIVRHPIAVGLSIMKRGWGNTAQAFLENDYYCERYLDTGQAEFSEEILKTGTSLEGFVLEWCLENIPLLQKRVNRPWYTVTYEELVARPIEMSVMLCQELGLPDAQLMSKVVEIPTRTTIVDSKRLITQYGPMSRAAQWQRKITAEERTRIQHILDTMGIKEYSASRTLPGSELLHFGRPPYGDLAR